MISRSRKGGLMRISVFGLGYVGSVSAACLARLGHTIIGVDVDADKVEAVRSGRSPIIEPELPELIRSAVTQNRLSAKPTLFRDQWR